MRAATRFGLLVMAVVWFGLASACAGGAKKVDADDWVAEVCDAALDFDDEMQSLASDLLDVDPEDGDEIKDAIEDLVKEGGDALDKLSGEIDDIGRPDIEGGAAVLKRLREDLKLQGEILKELGRDVGKLDSDDDDDFGEQVAELFNERDNPNFRDDLEDLDENDVDDLIDEIDEEPECAFVLFSD